MQTQNYCSYQNLCEARVEGQRLPLWFSIGMRNSTSALDKSYRVLEGLDS